MEEIEVNKYWEENAGTWTKLTRLGYDLYRDHLNTPAFFNILPPVGGLKGIDIGCGEGYNTRLLAAKGARLTAIDVSETFINEAIKEEERNPFGIEYKVASATYLPFADRQFDFATSFMCLMDVPDASLAIREAFRVLRPGGFFQFSISHPCFNTSYRKNLRDADGNTYAIEIGSYFKNGSPVIEEWIFGACPADLKSQLPKFKIPTFSRTLSQWVMALLDAGFIIEYMQEPFPDDEVVAAHPYLQDSQVVAYFLHIRCRKPH